MRFGGFGAVRIQHDQRLATFRIIHRHDPLAIMQPRRQAISSAVRIAKLLHGAVEVAERCNLPARVERHQVPGWMRAVGFEIFLRRR